MPRFTGQNKKRTDPRYFLNETNGAVGLPDEATRGVDSDSSEMSAALSKVVYAPARALSAIELAIRKATGIRGVLDPSALHDDNGKLIIPEPRSFRRWQKDYPTWYAAVQTFSNMTVGDPISSMAVAMTGGASKFAVISPLLRLPAKSLKKIQTADMVKYWKHWRKTKSVERGAALGRETDPSQGSTNKAQQKVSKISQNKKRVDQGSRPAQRT